MENKRTLSEILIEADNAKYIDTVQDCWREIVENKYNFSLAEIHYAKEHLSVLLDNENLGIQEVFELKEKAGITDGGAFIRSSPFVTLATHDGEFVMSKDVTDELKLNNDKLIQAIEGYIEDNKPWSKIKRNFKEILKLTKQLIFGK